MKEKFQCERAILRHEAEQANTPLWEMMDLQETQAKKEILNAVAAREFEMQPDDLLFDWQRIKESERFLLRVRGIVERQGVVVTPKLIKAARELLGWTINDLCHHS